MIKYVFLILFSFFLKGYTIPQSAKNKTFNLEDYQAKGDGITDDTPAFKALFKDIEENGGGIAKIPPGTYFLEGTVPIKLTSNTMVSSYGAKFYLPDILDDRSRIVLFQGKDVTDFSWFGGYFRGFCFDPDMSTNSWEPNVNTRIIVINTSELGVTENLTFKDISSDRIAGAVINVNGYSKSDNSLEKNYARNVSVENCTLINSGKFMWDYGFLWQIIVFSEYYSQRELEMAYKYFDRSLIIGDIKNKTGDSKIYLNNKGSGSMIINKNDDLCFFDDELPQNLLRGKRYYVSNATSKFIEISEQLCGESIVFDGPLGSNSKIINNVKKAFFQYAPIGSGPGKGCIDLDYCENTAIVGCKISALGDAMHVHACNNNVFSNNHILAARMGAFYLSNFCKNSTVSGNIVNGANGSRTISIEKSNENITMIGNVFRDGGRGSWINQPKNIIMQGNLFINNSRKGTEDHNVGRRNYMTGGWQEFPEIYFTTYEKSGEYGPVLLKDNIFITSQDAPSVIQFEEGGRDIEVEGNIFTGAVRTIWMDEGDTTINIGYNPGVEIKKGKQFSKPLFRNRL